MAAKALKGVIRGENAILSSIQTLLNGKLLGFMVYLEYKAPNQWIFTDLTAF